MALILRCTELIIGGLRIVSILTLVEVRMSVVLECCSIQLDDNEQGLRFPSVFEEYSQ